jgi:hypothetical protein
LSKLDLVNAADAALFIAAEKAIQVGAYQSLTKDLNKFKVKSEKEKLALVDVLDGTISILNEYHLINRSQKQGSLKEQSMPEIILSESFND